MITGMNFLRINAVLVLGVVTAYSSCNPKRENSGAASVAQAPSSDNATAASNAATSGGDQATPVNSDEAVTPASSESARFVVLKGDVNLDGKVDGDDGLAILQAGKYNSEQVASWCEGNIAGDDKKVDVIDTTEILAHQGANVVNKTVLLGDINMDGKVNSIDATIMNSAGKFGQAEAATWCQGDFTRDGKVDQSDADAMQANWLKSL